MNSPQNKVADDLENYVVNFNDLFGKTDENLKEKINHNAKRMEKIDKKLNGFFSKKQKNDHLAELNNYIWIKNIINENIEDKEKDEEKDFDEIENVKSVDMAKKYLEIRVIIL